jgi:cytoskeletal protein CcmA (bactofilin family)
MWKKENEAGSSSAPANSPRQNIVGSSSSSSLSVNTSPSQVRVPGFDIEATRLTPGIQIKGELSGRSDLYVDGEVQGKIRLSQSMLTVGPNGKVNADVDVREVIVHGTLRGNVQAHERVVLGRTSDVNGDITGQRITIEDGAKFKGRVDMAPAKDNRKSQLEAGDSLSHETPALAAAAAEGKDSSK